MWNLRNKTHDHREKIEVVKPGNRHLTTKSKLMATRGEAG